MTKLLAWLSGIMVSVVAIGKRVIYWESKIYVWWMKRRRRNREKEVDSAVNSRNVGRVSHILKRIREERERRHQES